MFQQTPQKRVLFPRILTPVVLGVLSVASILYAGFALFPQTATAAANNTVNFQARLEGAGGSIAPDGFYNIQFKLYNAASSGTNLWTESYFDANGVTAGSDNRVQVVNGYVSVSLGSQTAFPSTIAWNQDLYVTMNIGGTTQTATPSYDGEMNPRLSLTAVPYAFQAGQLAQFNGTSGFTSTLSVLQPTVGNQVFQIADQAAAGAYTLCVQGSASCGFAAGTATSYVQNTVTLQTGTTNFNISGSGTAATSILSPAFDRATTGTMSIGTTTATNITIGRTGQTVIVNSQLQANASILVNGTYGDTHYRVQVAGQLNSAAITNQYGIHSNVDFNPQGASLTSIYGSANTPSLVGSALNVLNFVGTQSGLTTSSGYTGQVTNGINILSSSPVIGGAQLISNYTSIQIATNLTNTGNISGTINNTQLRVSAISAGAGTGGTMNNTGIDLTMPNGSGGTTNNIGLKISGTSGGTSAFAIYSSATAASFFAGSIQASALTSASLTSSAGTTLSVTSGTTGALNLDSGTTGAINIGTGASSKTVTIGNTTGTTAVNINAGSGGIGLTGSSVTARATTNSVTAFQVQDTAGTAVLNIDSINNVAAFMGDVLTNDTTTGGTVGLNSNDGSIELASGNNSESFIDFKGSANLGADYTGRISYLDDFGFGFRSNGNTADALSIGLNGAATFKNYANSAIAFQVQNATAVNLFTIDSSAARLYVGPVAGDTVGTLLVLGNKTNSGDPTGVEGAIYYNSSYKRMRCYFDAQWRFCNDPVGLTWGVNYSEDFISNSSADRVGLGWRGVASGTGAGDTTANPDLSFRPGQVQLNTGTTATGMSNIYSDSRGEPILIGGGEEIEFAVNIPTLADATDNFDLRLGLCDADTSDCTDGVYIEYDRDSSTNWRYATASNSTRTKASSTTAVTTGWHRFKIAVNSNATSITFSVDGVTLGTTTTNIPTAAGRTTEGSFTIIKQAGTTSRTIKIDYFQYRQTFTTAR
jgi:hypothetical protein